MKYLAQFDRDKYHLINEMSDWCRANIGAGGYITRDHCVWKLVTSYGHSNFYFTHEKHYMLFMLRWA